MSELDAALQKRGEEYLLTCGAEILLQDIIIEKESTKTLPDGTEITHKDTGNPCQATSREPCGGVERRFPDTDQFNLNEEGRALGLNRY